MYHNKILCYADTVYLRAPCGSHIKQKRVVFVEETNMFPVRHELNLFILFRRISEEARGRVVG